MTSADEQVQPVRSLVADTRETGIASQLNRASECLARAWPATSPLIRRLQDLRQRLQDERLQLAVLGQFKRGKSTFLNALLGEPLLPSGIIPLTAIPTFIAWGARPCIRVTYRGNRTADEFQDATPDDIRRRLFTVVAEESNPRNRLDVARVDLFYPASILKNGVVLIDTPGIGSSHRHNTDAALQVLPECDAALFIVSVDPPITEAELAYLDLVRPKVARLFFILNKADYLEPQDLRVAADFLHSTVQQSYTASAATIFCVSALRGLKAKQAGDTTSLQGSGVAEIEDYLLRYLTHEKTMSLRTAISRKASDVITEAEADLSLRMRTLEMPLEDLENRSARLAEALDRIAAEARVIRDLLAGDRRRAVEQLEAHAERLRERGSRRLMDVLENVLSQPGQGNVERPAQEAVATAIPEFFEQELDETSRAFSHAVEEILAGHQRRIDDLVNLVRRTAAELFDVPYAASAEPERFKLGQEPYWVTRQWNATLLSIPTGLVDRLLPATARKARLRGQLQEQAKELVQRNVENLRWATLQGLDDTYRRFTAMLEERLAAAVEATQGAVKAAVTQRFKASDRIDAELVDLQRISSNLAAIREDLARASAPPPT